MGRVWYEYLVNDREVEALTETLPSVLSHRWYSYWHFCYVYQKILTCDEYFRHFKHLSVSERTDFVSTAAHSFYVQSPTNSIVQGFSKTGR